VPPHNFFYPIVSQSTRARKPRAREANRLARQFLPIPPGYPISFPEKAITQAIGSGSLGNRGLHREFYYSRIGAKQQIDMDRIHMDRSHPHRRFWPLTVASIVAAVGLLSLLLVDHGPWNRPHAQSQSTTYATTAEAAHAVGASVTPTEPKAALEPVAPGPKPAQPASPPS
jgi:hypothetical protein